MNCPICEQNLIDAGHISRCPNKNPNVSSSHEYSHCRIYWSRGRRFPEDVGAMYYDFENYGCEIDYYQVISRIAIYGKNHRELQFNIILPIFKTQAEIENFILLS